MKTSLMTPVKNALQLVLSLPRLDRAYCLSAIVLLAGLTIKAGDYDYEYSGGKVTINKYHGSGGAVTIPATIEGMPVIAIGHRAFYYCYSVTSVTIPNGVTRIEYEAFAYCGLRSINIGSGVTSIGRLALGCTGMTAISVNAGNPAYSSLDGVLFNKNKTALVQFPGGKSGHYTIPNGVKSVEDWAFYFCFNLDSITIPNSVMSIGEQAFYDCDMLYSVTIPNSVTNIGDRALYDCSNLTNVTVNAQNSAYSSWDGVLFNKNQTLLIQCPIGKGGDYMIPSSVTSIGDVAFYSCASLTYVMIPDSVISIKDGAFGGCSSMTNVWIGNSVTSIGGSAFSGCTQLSNVMIGNSVASIGGWAFYSCNSLRNISIPDSVSDIGDYAFTFCGLTSLTLPPKVTRIGDSTFGHCTGLRNLNIPLGVTNIGNNAFSYCTSLGSLTIPASVVNIGSQAFARCDELAVINVDTDNPNYSSDGGVFFNKTRDTLICYPAGKGRNFVIPSCVTSLGDYAFDSCTSLTRVFFQGNAPHAGSQVFPYALNLTIYYLQGTTGWGASFCGYPTEQIPYTLTVDNDAIIITGYAGSGGEVTIPYTIAGLPVTGIGSGTFSSCAILTSVSIPNSITNIGEGAFQNCPNLNVITVDEFSPSYSSLEGVLFNESLTRLVRYPEGKTGSYAIPDSVTRIDCQAFFGCMLTDIAIPAGVTEIGVGAFAACSRLTAITVDAQNGAYCMVDGVVFDINQTTLVVCPGGKAGGFAIPPGVTNISEYAFFECSSLTDLTIPDSVTHIGRNAFTGCRNLVNIMIPSRVAKIGAEAFGHCNRLTALTVDATNSVYSSLEGVLFDKSQTTLIQYPGGKVGDYTIPDRVASIGSNAFEDCLNLTYLTILNSVTNIESEAFTGCTGLVGVVIPDSVTRIEDRTFYGCSGLTCVTIPDSVTAIGNSAFASCGSLTNVTIGSSANYIGNESFSSCTNLTGIYFTGNAPSCGLSVFNGDNRAIVFYLSGTTGWGLTFGGRPALDLRVPYMYTSFSGTITITRYAGFGGAVNIPSTINGLPVSGIGDSAFSHCTGLTSVTIPDGVRMTIGSRAFYSCSNLTSVSIGNGVLNIGFSAFQDCTSLTNVIVGNGVFSINDYAFSGCTGLTSVTILNGVRMIGNGAFYGCVGLTGVTIPNSVTSFGYELDVFSVFPFEACTCLNAITVGSQNSNYSSVDGVLFNKAKTTLIRFPEGKAGRYSVPLGVTNIGRAAFQNCTGLTEVTITSGVSIIGERAFSWCYGLTDVRIPDSVTSIEEGAFSWCYGLTAVRIPDSVTSIGDSVFQNCTGLANVTTGNRVTSIGNFAFDNCPCLVNVVIGNRVASIGWNAFRNCTGLTGITIPDSVISIGDEVFRNCTGLTSMKIGNRVTIIGFSAFSGCIGLTDVTIPDSVTSIEWSAFEGCSSLANVKVGKGVTSIGSYAFYNCSSLISITIGNGVSSVGDYAFGECSELTCAFFKGNAPSVGFHIFLNDDKVMVYYLPATTGWDETLCDRPTTRWFFPLVTKQSPASDPSPVNEGVSISFGVTADDRNDPDSSRRGMSNITWYVDGTLKQETRTGAPDAITSVFSLKTDTNTVQGAAYRNVQVKAVALDSQGDTMATTWTVLVNNVPSTQTITFPAIPVKALGNPDFAPGARLNSVLTIEYTSSNEAVAEIVDGFVHIVCAGTSLITASQMGNFDFKTATPVKQTLTVKARLTTEVQSGGGTVTGAGLYAPGAKVSLSAKPSTGNTFLRWDDGSQTPTRNLVMPKANLTVSAWFGITTNVPKPVIADPGSQQAMVGVPFRLPLDIASDSLPAVTVAGLPLGLAYAAATKTIAGVPTASVTNRIVTVTAKNVNKVSAVKTFLMTVDPLPVWAVGAFGGTAGTDALGSGSASMSVTALGAATGKLTLRGTNFSFSAKSYASRLNDGAFAMAATASVGKVSWPLTLSLNLPEVTDTTGMVPQTLSTAVGVLSADGWIKLYRNVWKDRGMVTVLTNTWVGYYTATLPGGSECGSGFLTFTVDKLGGVKTVGKLADGTSVSLAGTLVLDEAGRASTVLCTAPAAYKGGGVFGVAEFFKSGEGAKVVVRLLDNEPFRWESFSPAATHDYGLGFSRDLGVTGGRYDTLGNLYGYYSNRVLSVGTEGVPAPELLVGTNRYGSVWWDPDGIVLTAVTNKSGAMTGLAAHKTGTPIKVGSSNVYDYAGATNAVGLIAGLTRPTGVFKGSFKAWFDYASTHTPKTIAYEGVLTPERENNDDGIAGRGYFLWADKSQYLNPLNKPVSYSFSWSYDFKILLSEPEP